jgi:hypothetical protein
MGSETPPPLDRLTCKKKREGRRRRRRNGWSIHTLVHTVEREEEEARQG